MSIYLLLSRRALVTIQSMVIARSISALRKAGHYGTMVLIMILLPAAPLQAQTAHPAQVLWQPAKLVNGSPVLFEVSTTAKVQSISGKWFGHDVVFFQSSDRKAWYGLGGVPVETTPGRYDLTVKEALANGKSAEVLAKIKVAAAAYPKITIKVAKQFTEPGPEQLREIAADKDVKQKA